MSIAQVLVIAALSSVGAVAAGALRARHAIRALYPEPLPADTITEGSSPPHDHTRPTAVLLIDHAGTEVSDFLLPYQLLAASNVFNVYAVAAEHRPATLTGGLDVMPDLSLEGLAQLLVHRPDLVVVPHLTSPGPALLDWVRTQSRLGAVVLTICTGASVAAQAGLLNGRRATAHWADLARFERLHPDVRWIRGVRYVDDGDICSSAGITSGIDATLYMIRRLMGDDAACRAAETIGWTDLGYLADPTTEQYRIEPADLVFPLTAAFGRRPRIGVLLRDGVEEASVAAVMDVHAATCTARLTTVSVDGGPVRTRHGLTLVPRAGRSDPRPNQLLVPTIAPAASKGAPAPTTASDPSSVSPHGPPHDAFRGALDDLKRRRGPAIARFAAKRLEYRNLSTPPAADQS